MMILVDYSDESRFRVNFQCGIMYILYIYNASNHWMCSMRAYHHSANWMNVTVVDAIWQFNHNIEMDHDDYQDLMCKITWKFIHTHQQRFLYMCVWKSRNVIKAFQLRHVYKSLAENEGKKTIPYSSGDVVLNDMKQQRKMTGGKCYNNTPKNIVDCNAKASQTHNCGRNFHEKWEF